MNQYFENLNPIVKEYLSILSDEIPEFLYDYIYTPAMQIAGKIGNSCGTNYTKLFNHKFFYSNLEHSIGVALIVWNFTKDKKQTLAALFHDIATPVFKHSIDFMNKDYTKQESTEELTHKIISNSKEIMKLLNRDNIKIEEVDDYHKYPIADNDTPKLSADRLEYNLSNAIFFDSLDILSLKQIKEIYNNLEVQKNEEGIEELGFKDKDVAEHFINAVRKVWPLFITNKDKLTMQFLADIVEIMIKKNLLTKSDLYTLSEKEVVEKIENCEIKEISETFKKFENTTRIGESDEPVENKYCINIKTKRRYIIPLVRVGKEYKRINEISNIAKKQIEDYLNLQTKKYAYFDFELKIN